MSSPVSAGFEPESFLAGKKVVIDVRSEAEYAAGHIPGAINIPVLNNEHRRLVGTCYKQEGRDAAVRLGFRLAGPFFADMIDTADLASPARDVFVYCWRGGMRSAFFGWILSGAGFRVTVIKGGYKKFRNWVLEQLQNPPEMLVVGGKTGSGKTSLLHTLSSRWPVIDLEQLASHRGSAFGHLGMPQQPSNEHFENLLAAALHAHQDIPFVLVENESRMIGKVKIPDNFYQAMRDSVVLKLEIPISERMKNILDEYGVFDDTLLASATQKIERKLGGLRLRQALQALSEGDRQTWLSILLEYYDENYEWSQSQRNPEKTIEFSGTSEHCLEQMTHYLNQKKNNTQHG